MRRILVIEDDRAAREVITRTLRAAGYQVLTAADGGEGLVVWEKEQPKVGPVTGRPRSSRRVR